MIRFLILAFGAVGMIGCRPARPTPQAPAPAVPAAAAGPAATVPLVPTDLDHVIVAVDSFDRGVAMLRAATGVTPHIVEELGEDERRRLLGRGAPGETQSALLSAGAVRMALLDLGEGRYLELVGPDPTRPSAAPLLERYAGYRAITPIAWAVRTRNLDSVRTALSAGGVRPRAIGEGERSLSAQGALGWRSYTPWAIVSTLYPSFVEWAPSSAHPSAAAPRGCSLAAFTLGTPEADSMRARLDHAGVRVVVAEARRPEMTLVLECPTGRVQFPPVPS